MEMEKVQFAFTLEDLNKVIPEKATTLESGKEALFKMLKEGKWRVKKSTPIYNIDEPSLRC
jgi:hypothetical protein